MYRAVIVEDNEILRKILFLMLKKIAPFQVQVVGFSENVEESVELIETLKPDLVFMDIELKNGTGFEILDEICFRRFHLIFTTSCEQYALKAFRYNAIDYLLKPINKADLAKALNKIENIRNMLQENLIVQEAPKNILLLKNAV